MLLMALKYSCLQFLWVPLLASFSRSLEWAGTTQHLCSLLNLTPWSPAHLLLVILESTPVYKWESAHIWALNKRCSDSLSWTGSHNWSRPWERPWSSPSSVSLQVLPGLCDSIWKGLSVPYLWSMGAAQDMEVSSQAVSLVWLVIRGAFRIRSSICPRLWQDGGDEVEHTAYFGSIIGS